MKTFVSTLVLALMLSTLGFAAGRERTFHGEIMDSACAKMGSHAMMMKKEGAKNAKECTIGCVKMGSKYVLYNRETKKIYQLDDQTKPETFAGENVDVKGTLDRKTDTIHVVDIETAS